MRYPSIFQTISALLLQSQSFVFRVSLTFKVNETGLKRKLSSSEHIVIQKDMQDISDPTGLPTLDE